MNNIKRSLILLASVALFASCTISEAKNNIAHEQQLQLTLRLEQQVRHIGEPVVATITLANSGEETVVVNLRMSVNLPPISSPLREVAFKITLPTGESYYPDVVIDPGALYNTHFIELQPGEFFEKVIYLDSYGYEFTGPGTYVIVANYQNSLDPKDSIIRIGSDDTRIAWKGELNSNEVLLTIIP